MGKKRKQATAKDMVSGIGDLWTWVALDVETKLIPSFVVGKRDAYHAKTFMDDLAGRLANRVQLTSDALAAYPDAIERAFGSEIITVKS